MREPNKEALLEVDYPLLFTFVFFFVFAGNMGRIEAVRSFFSGLLQKNTFLVSVISCQFISNVPTAVLLSQFTNNYPALLVGVNIGGVGTLIMFQMICIIRYPDDKTIIYDLKSAKAEEGKKGKAEKKADEAAE